MKGWVLDLCTATDFAVTNTFFDKNQNKLITFSSADNNSHIDYILVKRSFLKHVCDVKVICNDKCVTQQKLLVADITQGLENCVLTRVCVLLVHANALWRTRKNEYANYFSVETLQFQNNWGLHYRLY